MAAEISGLGVEITRRIHRKMFSNASWEMVDALIKTRRAKMYMHDEIIKMVLPLLKKYDLEPLDLIGEMNHAAWNLSTMPKGMIETLLNEEE